MTDFDPRAKLAGELAELSRMLLHLEEITARKGFCSIQQRAQRKSLTLRIAAIERKLKAIRPPDGQLDLFNDSPTPNQPNPNQPNPN